MQRPPNYCYSQLLRGNICIAEGKRLEKCKRQCLITVKKKKRMREETGTRLNFFTER